jgi:branched-chain amino acid transport system ATP-binding protein
VILEIEGLHVFYGPVQALRDVSLHVEEGEMVSLLGANGAGKTTTLRSISGLLSPRRGSIRIDGKEIAGMPAHKVVKLGVAQLPEGRELFAELTVLENLRLGHWARRGERGKLNERIESVFDMFPRLRERSGQQAGTMSGGEQQMLAAGRALMSQPRLLLIDELSLGLAPIIVAQLFETIMEVNRRGTAVLLVEQFVHMALSHTARAYVLSKGEVAAQGSSQEILASPELMAAYLGSEAPAEASSSTNGSSASGPGKKPSSKASPGSGRGRKTGGGAAAS